MLCSHRARKRAFKPPLSMKTRFGLEGLKPSLPLVAAQVLKSDFRLYVQNTLSLKARETLYQLNFDQLTNTTVLESEHALVSGGDSPVQHCIIQV